jgi:anti-anti-sigma factor
MSHGETDVLAQSGEPGDRAVPPGQDAASSPGQAAVTQYGSRGTRVVVARGEYDCCTIVPLAEALTAAARNHSKVVLDASAVTFADSSLLNLLVRTHPATTLRVAAPRPQLQRLLKISGLDTLVQVRATVEEAAVT